MSTLIFVEERDLSQIRPNARKLRFLKKGGISDALAHFDDTYPSFHYERGQEGFDEKFGHDSYYLDDQGGFIISGDEVETFFPLGEKRIHVSAVNNLSVEELMAVYGSDGESAIYIFIENGIPGHEFSLMHGFGVLHEILSDGVTDMALDWFMEDVMVHSDDPEDDGRTFDYPVVYKGGLYYTYKGQKNEQ